MAATYTSTGTNSNLTRLQLEQLRKSDDYAGGKALTVGDSSLPSEGVVGPGDVNAEPFLTNPSILLDAVYSLTPPTQPGPGLGTVTQPGIFSSETVKWFGPTYITDGTKGYASASNVWTDVSGVNFTLSGVQAGDILLIKPSSGSPAELNPNTVATVVSATSTALTVDHIYGPGAITSLSVDSGGINQSTDYIIVRPNAVQLFAVPASGATGFEQSFMAVVPGTSLHSTVAPTTDEINAARIPNLVPSQYALNSTVDRADAVFDSPGPRLSLDLLGYRVILYPDNGSGTGPNLSSPVATLDPVIDPSIPSTDQRMTIDYKSGIIRFSCEPKIGGQIKVSGGVNATTGRLNLYAIFWAVDTSLTAGASRSLYGLRSQTSGAYTPGRVYYDTINNAWRVGATTVGNALAVVAPDPSEDARISTSFGTYDATASYLQFRYFTYRQGSSRWKFVNSDAASDAFSDTPSNTEMPVGQALEYTVADITAPPSSGADFPSPQTNITNLGARNTSQALATALLQAATGDFSTVRLKRGQYNSTQGTLYMPPGVTLEGDGGNTTLKIFNSNPSTGQTTPGFKFGPNTTWGVYDLSYNGTNVVPTVFDYSGTNVGQRLEGVALVWNPVTKVWGIAWADLNLDAVWFNEVHRDGTTTFPGFGINVKTTTAHLFSALSANSANHTAGHYPRLAYQANASQYVIAWVDELTISGVIGPSVIVSTFQVSPAVSDPTPGNPQGSSATFTLIASPFAFTTGAFTDHPSVAVDNSVATFNWTILLQCWKYNFSSGSISSSSPTQNVITGGGSLSLVTSNSASTASNHVISSTDVDEDGTGNFLCAYSLRYHPFLTGFNGSFNTGGYFSDSGVSNWTSLGVVVGSKFCYLGSSLLPSAHIYDPVYGYPGSYGNPVVAPYGTDGTVTQINSPTLLELVNDISGGTFSSVTPYQLVSSTYTTISSNTLTDSTAPFYGAQVAVGDLLITTTNNLNFVRVTNVNSSSEITVATSITADPPGTYKILAANVNRVFSWAIAPPSIIQYVRFLNGVGFAPPRSISGVTPSGSSYYLEPTEPDYVRVRRGGDNWIVVYQAMKTTAYMASDSQTNWNDASAWNGTYQPQQTTWNNAAFVDSTLVMKDFAAPYRRHLSTCAVVLSSNGVPLTEPYNMTLSTSGPPAFLDIKASRDVEISNRSLGAVNDPLTYRPNYASGNPPSYRVGCNLALEISPICFFHRWTSSYTPSLIPDVTWTGEDWVVVSPTKKSIHSYTGNYIVAPSGLVYFGDPAFYFGTNSANAVDLNYLRQTVEVGDKIYFPVISKYGTIAASYDEHMVTLVEADSTLFHYGNGISLTQNGNIEWVLVRASTSGTRPGGVKNLGYRVSADGQVIVSSSLNSFADELPDYSRFTTGVADYLPLMSRSNNDKTFFWNNVTADGHNLPGNIYDDTIDQEARYLGDVGFRGVSPGAPHGCNDQVTSSLFNEPPFCAIAWGENFYGFIEHVAEGSTSTSTAINQVRFYRQSFGPYRSGIRNLKIFGNYQSNPSSGSELRVLTQNHVLTRHGGPVEGHGFFATDGYRNFFPVADKRGMSTFVEVSEFVTGQLFGGGYQPCIQGFYTDAVGRYPIEVQGPETQNKPYPGQETPSANTLHGDLVPNALYSPSISPSAPRTLWDGSRFVVVWTEGGYLGSETSPLLCISTFQGSEDAGFQGPELVNPNDFEVTRRTAQIALVEPRNTYGTIPNGSIALVVCDIAFSGKVYAVLWAAGLDQNSPIAFGQAGATLGITLFENLGGGGTLYDFNPQPYASGSTAATLGFPTTNTITDSTVGAFTKASPGDILIVTAGINEGRYLITQNLGSGSVQVYPNLLGPNSSINYSTHVPLAPGGAPSYVLGSTWQNSGARDVYVSPCITWDGKQFVAAWRGKIQAQFNPDIIAGTTSTMQYLMFPETGLAHPTQAKLLGTYPVTSPGVFQDYQGIGLLAPNIDVPGATFIFLVNANPSGFVTGTNATTVNSGTTSTVTDFTVNLLASSVSPGDVIVFTSPSTPNYGVAATIIYITLGGTYSVLTVSNDLYTVATDPASQAYTIYKKQFVNVQAGDILRISGINPNNTHIVDTTFNGDYEIVSVDSYNNIIFLSAPLIVTAGILDPNVYGTIITGGGYGAQLPLTPYGVSGGSLYLGIGSDVTATPRALGTALLSTQSQVVATNPDYIFRMVYNEVNEEYAILYSSAGSVAVGVFDHNTCQIKRETLLYEATGSNAAVTADLAWNGSRYFVVFGTANSTGYPSIGNTIPLDYKVLTPGLQIEDSGAQTFSSGVQNLYTLVGNGVGQIPGPTYASPNFNLSTATGTQVAPVWKNCQVRWNGRLNRWVVSASIVWTTRGAAPAASRSKYDFYSGEGCVNTAELVCEYPLNSTTIASISGNQITVNTVQADASFMQPGLKLAFISESTGAWAAVTTILNVTSVTEYSQYILTVSTSFPASFPIASVTLDVLPREDVFVWTLGYNTPVVQFEDADSCFLENVTISGGTADIEERYVRQARPSWQTGGAPVGAPTASLVLRPSQYNHLLLTPESKVSTPKVENVRSYTKYRNTATLKGRR
jgi:hypothetical protein